MVNTFIAVDIETTGLNPKSEKVIEIGAVKVVDGILTEEFQTLIQPNRKLNEFITNLTGITDEMLESAPEEEEAFAKFLAFAGEEVLLGHHLIFDYSFLKRMAVNQNVSFERKGIDTLKIAKTFLPELEKRTLDFLCAHYQIVNVHAHRAYEDARVTAQVYQRMAENFYDGTEKAEKVFSPEQLLYQAKKESPITQAQVRYLKDLTEYHHLTLEEDIEKMSKNTASRKIDQILSTYGRII